MTTKTDDKTNGVLFQWKIENISHCWLRHTQRIVSPSFTADELEETKWSLLLYPMGDTDENYVGVFLIRKEGCSGPNAIEVQFQLAFLSKDGSLLKKNTSSNCNFEKGNSLGYPNFVARNLIFVTNREAFLPEDTLTVQCMIWKKGKKPVKPERFHARTVFKVNRKSFMWRINDFSSLKPGFRNEFKDDSIEFDLVLNEGLDFEKKLFINIKSFDENMEYFSFRTSIIDSEDKKEDCGTHEYYHNDLKKGVLSTLLFTKKLMENRSRYLPNDVLSLDCEYVYSNGSVLCEYCVCGIISPKINNEIVESRKERNYEKEDSLNAAVLSNDLKLMYNEAICSDIEIRTSTQTFLAHKSILSARSPVFRSMFSNDMRENNSGHIDITDFEDNTIHRMLLYVYTDSLEDLRFESASKLYAAADKYQIMCLRNKCSSFLKNNLCPTNACDVLVLADLHHDEDLKSAVQDYILRQHKQIFCSQEWKDFMNSHIKLAAVVMYEKIYRE